MSANLLVDQLSQKGVYSVGYIKYVIFLLMLANVVNYMDRVALSVLLPSIKKDLLMSDTQLGLLTGAAFAIVYAIFCIPIARWADKGSRRNIIALALLAWSGMTALSGAAQNFFQLFAARVGVGIGEAGCYPPSQSLISDYVPIKQRTGALSLHTAGASIGIVIGLSLAGWLSGHIGWRGTFLTLAIPGMILAVVVKVTLKDPPRGYADGHQEVGVQQETRDAEPLPMREVIQFFLRCRSYIHILVAIAIINFVAFSLLSWMPSFYERTFDLSMVEIGSYYGLANGCGGFVGLLSGGFLSNRLSQHDIRYPILLGAGAAVIAIPIYFVALTTTSVSISFICIFFATLMLGLSVGPKALVAQSVVKPDMRAMSSAVVILVSGIVGFSGGPLLIGVLSDYFSASHGTDSLRYALILILPLLLWAVVHMFFSQ